MPELALIERYLGENSANFEAQLFDLLRIPSISTDRKYATDVRRAAIWIFEHLTGLGFETELIETNRHPIVFGQSPPVAHKPSVLVYGHYDVQPPDPLEEWVTPPFEPAVREGNVYARGATDDKGQMLTHIKSAEAWQRAVGELPIQLKFLIEGEEEVGSGSLYDLLESQPERLRADVVVVSDSSQFAKGQPAITYGLRGISYYELVLTGPSQDLHSGLFGGAVSNPANALATMLAALVDRNGRIQVPGFYDAVEPLPDFERQQFAELPFNEEDFKRQIGVEQVHGEVGFTTFERRWARPSFDIHGLNSGYQGEGAKTVLPARASAKFSFRLVPHQVPGVITDQLKQYLHSLCPPGIKCSLKSSHGKPGVVLPLDSPFVSAAAAAIEDGFGKPPVFIRSGGSIPIVTAIKERLGMDTLLLGWGQSDDNLHSPNEKFSLADFHRGIRASARLWYELGQMDRPGL